MLIFKILLILLIGVGINLIKCDITPQIPTMADRIYAEINMAFPCAKLLTSDGQFGCTSKMDGNSGALYLIDSDDSYQSYLNSPTKDVILLFDANYFNKTIVNSMILKKIKIEGIIVLTDTAKTYPYSPDVVYPNKKFGLYPNSQIQWNPNGDSFSYQDFSFPIFSTDQNFSSAIRSYALDNRNGIQPAVGAQLRSFMQASENADVCLRRGFCEPLGGKSIWSTFSPEISTTEDILMVMIPMDATAFFHDIARGADSTAYAQVVLLSIMNTLSRVDKSQWKMQVIFAMWNGEKWGYLGSNKMVDDLLNFKCQTYTANSNETACDSPYYRDLTFESIKFENIKMIIELNQIGLPELSASNQSLYYLHSYQPLYSGPLINNFVGSNSADSPIFYKPSTAQEIPPSSVMSFLKQNTQILNVIVTDHDQEYRNQHYGDVDDDQYNVDPDVLGGIIKSLSTIIDAVAGGDNSKTIELDSGFYQTIYSCLIDEFTCLYVNQFLNTYPYNPTPNFYPGIYATDPYSKFSTIEVTFLYNIMMNISASAVDGSVNCTKNSQCQDALPGSYCLNSVCILSNTHYHDAVSLGIAWDEKSSAFYIQNSSYPTFVESNWDFTDLRLYQLTQYSHEVVFLVMGILEFIISVIVIIFIRIQLSKKYKLL